MPQLRIDQYGIIGDLHTIALVGINGSIDWLCFPHFDSPSIFAAILDDKKGGRFQIAPVEEDVTCKQFYWPDTNVLVTRFFTQSGIGEVVDYMPIDQDNLKDDGHDLIRKVSVIRGNMEFRLIFQPAFNYGRDNHEVHFSQHGVVCASNKLRIGLSVALPLDSNDNHLECTFTLQEGQSKPFYLYEISEEKTCRECLSPEEAQALFVCTVDYWRNWLSQCTYKGRWREIVHRSALALKLMTFEPTGAIIASPTTSLPEHIGGERNWDYRYTWIRDAAFTLYALLRIGFTEEAAKFMHWLEDRCKTPNADGSLQIMYSIDGRKKLTEEILNHLAGYKNSGPVRIGNDAYQQLQLDIYGELMDSVYLYNKYGVPISYDLWTHLRRLINWVCDHWEEHDEGIWEVRGGRKPFVYSRLMCWVAVDRGLRLAEKRSFPADREKWLKTRDRIYETIMQKGWDENHETFIQFFGSQTLDASSLLMPLVFFLSPADPRMIKTIEAIMKPPKENGLLANSLVYRYNTETTADGIGSEEGTFNACTFWLVEALTRAGKTDHTRLDKARLIFEEMLGYANHVGLYSEETGSRGEALGNFPQAFTHIALISAAFNLDRALGKDA